MHLRRTAAVAAVCVSRMSLRDCYTFGVPRGKVCFCVELLPLLVRFQFQQPILQVRNSLGFLRFDFGLQEGDALCGSGWVLGFRSEEWLGNGFWQRLLSECVSARHAFMNERSGLLKSAKEVREWN